MKRPYDTVLREKYRTCVYSWRQYMWHQANYNSLCKYLSTIDWPIVVYNNPSAEQSWNAVVGILKDAVELFVPKAMHCYQQRKIKPRYPRAHRECAATKRNLWKKLMKRPYDTVLREKYRTCVYSWRQLLVSSQTRVEENLISADNVGAFYRYVNRRITSNSSVGVIVDHSGAVCTSYR